MSDEQQPGPEGRVFRRTELPADVEIEVEGADVPRVAVGEIMDVGVGGILVRVAESMAEGTLCTVRFADPEVGALEARGLVRRVRVDSTGFLLGIEFENRLDALRTPNAEDHLDGFELESTKILVVDDEPSVVELLYRFLTSRGCEVSTASSGPEALNMLRSDAPDITVLDLKMPGMDGLEVLETIREEKLEAGKVWAVSGYATDAEAREALRQGAADFISKPLDLKYLEWSMQLYRAAL
jgi:CheY-like chemotaxis protein